MIKLRWLGCALLLGLAGMAFSQAGKSRLKFSDYPVKQIYKGKPARPILSKEQQVYRTRIREGSQAPVQFAGHYTVPRFGCGAGCSVFYVVDSIKGRVYQGFAVSDLPSSWMQQNRREDIEQMEFHPNSRLLKINGCPGETNCGFYDYEMVDGGGLKLVRKELLPREFQ